MKILVNVLIIFFLLLLFYQVYIQVFGQALLEGLDSSTSTTYQPYDMNNPNNALILSQQNAGNIQYLQEQVAGLQGMQKQVNDLSLNIVTINDQIQGLVQQQQEAATQLVGTTPLTVTGTSSA